MERSAPAALLLFLQVLAALGANRGRYVGDLCTMKNGLDGLCQSLNKCPEVQEELKAGSQPVICSYSEFTPIVCCPQTRVASRMCKTYGDAVYRYDNDKSNQVRSVVNQCAMKTVPFIIGGSKASPNEYPHMALLGYGNDRSQLQWGCGASLISNRFVLTAAHCLLTRLGPPKWVRLGELDVTTDEESRHEDFDVVERIVHPDYIDGVRYNDVGLLKLDRDVVFSASIRPACLHPTDEIQDKLGIACGFGVIDWTSIEMSTHLMKLNLHITETDVCNSSYKTEATTNRLRKGIEEESMICGGSPEGGKDTCKGDSGGPFMIKLSSPYCMYSLIGITSFGKGSCGTTTAPAVYTRVSHYISWIEKTVWPRET